MGAPSDLERLAETLRNQYRGTRPRLTVELRDQGRLLTVLPEKTDLVPESPRLLKRSRRARPKGKAFELYVSREAQEAAPTQRIAPPMAAHASLTIEKDMHEGTWTVPGAGGERIVVHLRRGEDMSAEEARRLLETVRQGIAP